MVNDFHEASHFALIFDAAHAMDDEIGTGMSKKSKDRLRDPALQVTMWDHATYPSTFLTYL